MKKKDWLGDGVVKGAIVFILQEVGVLTGNEIVQALNDIFGHIISPEQRIRLIKHLQDRNLISVIYGNRYHLRKANYSDLEVAQIRDLVSTHEILQRDFARWRSEKLGK